MAELLNLSQAAKLAGVSRGTIYRALRDGTLTAARGGRPGRLTLIEPDALRTWCASEGLSLPERSRHAARSARSIHAAARPQRSIPAASTSSPTKADLLSRIRVMRTSG
jgi:excisionase family DNA binding protein